MQTTNTTAIGQSAEAYVAAQLRRAHYKIIAQNWRTRYCEIDIIARHKKTYVFIEVKYRRTADFGDIGAVISAQKRARLRRAAALWLSEQGLDPYQSPLRIDVAYVWPAENSMHLSYQSNAIGLDEHNLMRYS